MSKELRIGLLVGISILVFFAGFYFLKGSNLFRSEHDYYTYYENAQGLQASAPVQYRGVQIGKVSAIELDPKGVKVTLSIADRYKVPKGSVAKMVSADLLNSKAIRLDYGTSSEAIPDEGTMASSTEGGVIDQVSSEITPLVKNLQRVSLHLDTALLSVNNAINPDVQRRFQDAVLQLDAAAGNFAAISSSLAAQRGAMARIVQNANSITSNFAASNDDIKRILANLESATAQLKDAPIEQTMAKLQGVATELEGVTAKLNSPDNSVGKLLTDTALYYNVNQTVNTVAGLAEEIKRHPSRFINITIFGRRARVGE